MVARREHKVLLLIVLILLVLGCVAFYLFVDPVKHLWVPQCPFRLLSGWNCPACGIQRALHALLNGRPAEALSYNYFLVLGIPYALALLVAEGLKCLRSGEAFVRMVNHPVVAKVYVVLFFVWGIARNVLGI